MSEGCIGCTVKTKDREKERAIKDALAHAVENKIPVAIYQEAGEWKYCNAFLAYANKYPVEQVVSEHSSITTE